MAEKSEAYILARYRTETNSTIAEYLRQLLNEALIWHVHNIVHA